MQRNSIVVLLCLSSHGLGVAEQGPQDMSKSSTSAPMIVKLKLDVTANVNKIKKHFYSAVLSVGGPNPQNFRMGFDLGGGTTMLPSKDCKAKACLHKNLYNKWDSALAEDVKRNGKRVLPLTSKLTALQEKSLARGTDDLVFGSLELGDGEAHGHFVQDKVCFESQCFTLGFLHALDMDEEPFIDEPYDGIVGLGPGALVWEWEENTGDEFDFLSSLAGALPGRAQKMFGLSFSPGEGVELAFGGYDQKRLGSPISWVPIASAKDGRWQVQMSAIRVGNATLDVCSGVRCLGVLDYGTSYLGVPAEVEDQMERQISAASAPQDCDKPVYPDLQIELNGITVTVPGDDYALPGGRCVPDLETHSYDKWFRDGDRVFLLGEAIMRHYYTIFDKESNRIGFSKPNELSMTDDTVPKEKSQSEVNNLPQVNSDVILLMQSGVTVHSEL